MNAATSASDATTTAPTCRGCSPTLVQLENPDGAILPVRGEYDEASPDPRIGVNPLRYHGTVTLGDIADRYPRQPELKSLDAHGQPAVGTALGLLQRRPVESAPVLTDLIGKEANLLEERLTGQVGSASEYREGHGTRGDRWTELVLPVLRRMGANAVIARTGRKKTAVYEALAGTSRPLGAEAAPYRRAAVEWATERLREGGQYVPRHPDGVLYRFCHILPVSQAPGRIP